MEKRTAALRAAAWAKFPALRCIGRGVIGTLRLGEPRSPCSARIACEPLTSNWTLCAAALFAVALDYVLFAEEHSG